ncbi:acyl-CoA dehydrogenase family protein [Streptomyces sp. NPDC102476]|uniref:acyl-CoA dehydrogenase family protein n=1 Tax=Streptomyces sp. NPDC102476 TaxID=3366181 RepID=UPI0038221500
MRQFARERIVVAMGAVADCQAALGETVAHVKECTTFGRPFAKYQANPVPARRHARRGHFRAGARGRWSLAPAAPWRLRSTRRAPDSL